MLRRLLISYSLNFMILKAVHFLKKYSYLSALLLGALYTLGFAPFSVWPTSMLALLGVFMVLKHQRKTLNGFMVGLCFGFAHYITSIHWLLGSFIVSIDPYIMALLLGCLSVFALSLFMALFIAIPFALFVKFQRKCLSCFLPVFFAIMWVLFEYLRSILEPTFAWNLVAHVWAFEDYLLQSVPYLGVFGLSFVFVLMAAGLNSRKGCYFVSALLALMYGYGWYVLKDKPLPSVAQNDTSKLHVQMVPGFVLQKEKWQADKRWDTLSDYIRKSNITPNADMTIWPETALTYFIEQDDVLREYVRNSISSPYFVFGAPAKVLKGLYYNSMFVMNGDGVLSYRYDKRFLVPFGEYFPLREYFPDFFEKFLQGQGSYSFGDGESATFNVKGVRFAPLICGEIVLPFVEDVINTDADYVLNITNDAWFRGFIGPSQHLAIAKFQSAVIGKPVIRVAHGGASAVFDRYGRVVFKRPERGGDAVGIYLW